MKIRRIGAAALLMLLAACQRPAVPTSTAAACIDTSKINPQGICTMEYAPVCGCDDHTYANACVAANAGVRSTTPGPCTGGK